jgi:hypothetical protein
MVDDEAKHESLMGDIMIDYARAKAKSPALKAALTRAKKQVGNAHYPAVLAACKAAVKEWEQWGAWPDGWHTWNIALGDAAFQSQRLTGRMPEVFRLEQI